MKKKLYKSNPTCVSIFSKESYGCLNFQPDDYPDGEDENSQMERKAWLQNEFHNKTDIDAILPAFERIYVHQRCQINKKDSNMATILEEFPHFVYTPCIFKHFEILMGFKILEKFDESIVIKSPDILKYVRLRGTPESKEILEMFYMVVNDELISKYGALAAIPYLIGDDLNLFFRRVDVSFF